jgi:predicted RNA binding protein YcfA (HicA-like mRNA interferase family)
MTAKDLIKKIEADGWYFVRQNGSHKIYQHPTKQGT